MKSITHLSITASAQNHRVNRTQICKLLILFFLTQVTLASYGATYYSIATGNWNANTTWSLTSGGTAVGSGIYPKIGDNAIIEGGKTVTLNTSTANLTAISISSGSTLTTTSNYTVTATTITVNGTYINGSTGTVTGTITVGATGTYQHNQDGGIIPTATWSSTSTCIITGYVSQAGGVNGALTPFQSSMNQSFGNFTWNCPNQTTAFSLGGTVSNVSGNYSVISTGSGSLAAGGVIDGDITVAGNFIQSGGNFQISSAAARTMTVNGNFTKTGGTFDLTSTTTATYPCILSLKGNFSFTGGTITESGSSTTSEIDFAGTSQQTLISTGTYSNKVNFAILNGAVVDFGTNTISAGATGNFTLNAGATLITANTNGTGAITNTGTNGCIQVTGTRTYSPAANYTFNGTSNQTIGNGLPTNLTGKLTIINSGTSGNNTVTLNNAIATANGASIYLTNGILGAGTNLTINTATSTIYRSEGSMTGTIQGAGPGTYNVVYTGNTKICGTELSGGGLNSITISLTSGQTLTLDQNRTPDGNLYISSGSILNLSSFTLNRSAAGGTATLETGSTLKIGGTNTFPTNYNTHSINCNSTVEYAGTNQTVSNLNSGQSYGNLTLSGSGTKTLQTGTTAICKNFTVTGTANTTGVTGLTIGGNVLIDVNALFTAGAFTHYVSGNWTKSGTFTATGSTINFNSNSAAQTIGASNFNHITFSGAGTKTATGVLTIAGDATISSNFSAGSFNHSIAGAWTNNGTFDAGTSTVTLSATTAKTIGGSSSSQFYNLTLNETGSSTLGINTSVTNTLTLTQGLIDVSTYTFTVAGITGGSAASYIKTSSTGRLKRQVTTGGTVYTFPVGNSAYNPISFSSSATGNGNSDYFSVRVEDGALTNANVNTKTVNRKWYMMAATTGITSLNVSAQYNAGETGPAFNAASSPRVGFFTGTAWGYSPNATASGSGPYTITASGTAPEASSTNAFVALGSEDAFSASKLAITVLPPTPYRGISSSIATVQSQNSQGVPTWVLQSTYFDLTSNKSFTRAGGLTGFAIAAGTHETVINNIQFLVSTWNTTNQNYDTDATVTATRTSGESLTSGTTPQFAIKDGSIYRPKATGNWNSVQWEISSDGGGSWTNTTLPTNSIFAESDVIQVPAGITLTANTNASFYSLVITGTLDIASSTTLTLNHSANDLGDYNISVYGTLKNSGGTITNSNSAYTPLYVYGGTYWHNRDGGAIPTGSWNTLNGTPSTCKITGISSTAISSGLEQSFQNLIWDNVAQSATQTLNADINIANTLTLSNGVITTSTNKVVIGQGGTSTSTNNARINGNIRIQIPTTSSPTINFPIGDASYYTPLTVAFTGTIVGSGYLDAYTTATQPPLATGLSQTKYVKRLWTVSNTNISGFSSFNITFAFADADKTGTPNTSALVVRKKDNNIWAVTSTGTQTANSTQCTNMTSFSDFAIGEDDCTSTNYIWLGGTSTDWNTASNWCYNQVPGATVDVTIPAGPTNQPVISNSATCKNVSIANGASLTLSGSNSLSIKGNLTNNGTVTTNTGTISFTGSSAQSITGNVNFYNLTINNTGGVVSANDLTVNGTLNLQSSNASSSVGALDMGSNTLTMGTDALTTGTGDVTGIVKRQQTFAGNTAYTFGNANTNISFTNVPGASKPSWISCKITLGTAPTWRSQAIKRTYSFAQDGSGTDRTVVHLHYLDTELHDAETDENKLVFWDAYTGPDFSNKFPRSKSNSDATNNWVGLAGMAINFFAPSSTLDNKQWSLSYTNVSKIIWTGSGAPTDYGDWSHPGNWNGGVPTANDDVLIPATLPGDTHGYPIRNLNQSTTPAVCNSIEIENGATLTVDNYPITISGSTGAWINNGTFVPGTGTVTFNHSNQSEIVTLGGTTNFYNLCFGANTVMRPNNGMYIGIGGNLTYDGSSILDFSSSTNTVDFKGENQLIPNPTGPGNLRGYYHLILSSSGTSTLQSQLNISGNLTINTTANGTTNNTTLICEGTSAQTISGSSALTLGSMTINNASGVTASTNLALNGALTFITDNPTTYDKGALAMTTDKILDLGANATITGPGDVSGIVRRSHTFNTSTFYAFGNENNGLIFAAVSGYPGQTLPSSVSLKTNIGTAPNWSSYLGAPLTSPIKRNWEIIQTGGSGTRALMRVHYRDNEIQGGISENSLTIWTSSWIPAYNNFYNKESGRSNYNTDLNYIAIQDVDFAIIPSVWGNFKSTLAPATSSTYTWIGTISTDWNNPSNWTPNSVPDATHGAIIPNTYTTPYAPTLPASATCKSVQLNAGAVLNAAASGGVLTITGANAAWNAETGAVFNANTSQVIFSADALTAGNTSITGTTGFYDVSIANGALLRPASSSYTRINGTLTINGTLAAATTENTFEFTSNSSQNIPNPNGSTAGYHNLVLSGSGTKNLPATLNIVDEFINNTTEASTVNAGYGTVSFNGNAVYGQSISGTTNTTFNNVICDNPSHTISVENNISINGSLEITSGSILDMKTNALSGSLSSISGTGIIKTQHTGSTPIPAAKTWTGQVDYNGTVAQTVVAGTYTDLTIENIAGATAGGDLTVNGILNLATSNPGATKGLFDTDIYTLNMGAINTLAAITTGIGDVTGIVKRAHTFEGNTVYTFGNPNTSITFVNFPNTTKPGWVSCKISLGTAPEWRGVAVRRYYSFAKDAGSDRTVLKLHYLDSELNTETTEPYEPNENKLELWDAHNGPTWTPVEVHGKSANDPTANWVGLAGMSIGYITSSSTLDNKQWGLSYSNVTKKTWTGQGFDPNDWALPGNWDGGIPTASDPVLIPAGLSNYPTKNLDPTTYPVTIKTLEIEQGASMAVDTCTITLKGSTGAWINNGTFTAGTGKVVFNNDTLTNIMTIAGATTFNNLQVKGNTYILPATNSYMGITGTITYDPNSILDFVTNNNTVEYKGTDQSIINLPGASNYNGYHNLTLSGSETKTLPATLNIAGDFTNNGTMNAGTGTVIIKDQGHIQNIGGSSTSTFYNLTIDNTDQIANATAGFNVNNQLTINAQTALEMNTFALGGTFASTSGTGTLKTQCTSTTPIPSGITWTFGVLMNNTGSAQSIPAGTYASLQNSNPVLLTASGALNCTSLILDNATTLDMGTYALSGGSSISGTGTLKTQCTTATPLPSGKTWPGNVVYNGISAQTAVSGTFGNIGIENTAGVTLAAEANINVVGYLFINNSKYLIIPTGTAVSAQTITNNAGISGITILSNPNTPNGSLIFFNNTNNPVSGTVQMYSKAAATSYSNGVYSGYKWQYFGIPIKSIVADPTFYGCYVRKYNEAGIGIGSSPTNYWISQTNSSILNSFNGYEITQPTAKTITFQGTLVNGDFNSGKLSYTSGATNKGQHLIGNSYTSAIDISKINFGSENENIIENTVYLFNTGSYSDWVNNGASGTVNGIAPGQYISIPKNMAGQLPELPGQIPSMQAFLLKVNSDDQNANIQIPYASANTSNTGMQRISSTTIPYLQIKISGKRYSDNTWISINDKCKNSFDNGWDGYKIISAGNAPQVWTIENNINLQINCKNELNNTYLGFRCGEDTVYTLTVNYNEITNIYPQLYMVDIYNRTTIPIEKSGTSITFKANASTPLTRFKIVTALELTTDSKNQPAVGSNIFNEGSKLHIQNMATENAILKIFDLSGKLIRNYQNIQPGVSVIESNVVAGDYILHFNSGGKEITRKIVVFE